MCLYLLSDVGQEWTDICGGRQAKKKSLKKGKMSRDQVRIKTGSCKGLTGMTKMGKKFLLGFETRKENSPVGRLKSSDPVIRAVGAWVQGQVPWKLLEVKGLKDPFLFAPGFQQVRECTQGEPSRWQGIILIDGPIVPKDLQEQSFC